MFVVISELLEVVKFLDEGVEVLRFALSVVLHGCLALAHLVLQLLLLLCVLVRHLLLQHLSEVAPVDRREKH